MQMLIKLALLLWYSNSFKSGSRAAVLNFCLIRCHNSSILSNFFHFCIYFIAFLIFCSRLPCNLLGLPVCAFISPFFFTSFQSAKFSNLLAFCEISNFLYELSLSRRPTNSLIYWSEFGYNDKCQLLSYRPVCIEYKAALTFSSWKEVVYCFSFNLFVNSFVHDASDVFRYVELCAWNVL